MSKAERYMATIVPVYEHYSEKAPNPTYLFSVGASQCFAIRDSSGEFEQFDNDGDYIEYTEVAIIVHELSSYGMFIYTPLYDLKDKFRSSDAFIEDPSTYYAVLSKCMDTEKSLIDGVSEYLYGNKSKITDTEIFSSIDEYYYNHHPDNWNKYLFESKYGSIKYLTSHKVGDRTYLGIEALSAPADLFYLADKTPVPKGSLILGVIYKTLN